MKVSELIDKSYIIGSYNDIDVKDIAFNSSDCRTGSLFFAIKGKNNDGNDFASQAIENGAYAIVTEKRVGIRQNCIRVHNIREVAALAAKHFYKKHPIDIAGITGTNGKTTTSYLIDSILKAANIRSGVIGTIAYRDSKLNIDASMTTPDPLSLWKIISMMQDNGDSFIVMEVSSHAISQKRIFGIDFKEKIFTNFSQDHLDYYKTMEYYENSKLSFFDDNSTAIINGDSMTGKKIIKLHKTAITYGFDKNNFVHPVKAIFSKDATTAVIAVGGKAIRIRSELLGRYNLYNIMAALGFAHAEGIELETAKKGIENLKSVPGRIEKITHNGIDIYIDYAHTPDALYKVGDCIKSLNYKRIITVFGAGGNRDRTKRAMMAEAVEKFSDTVIVTNDNPRNENPMKIIKDILTGFTKKLYTIETDRKNAIKRAILIAKSGEAILIAGKGHETYQIIGNKRYFFSDKAVVSELISKL